jgi:hypothetical protein
VVAAALLMLLLAVGGLATGLVLIGRERGLTSANAKEASDRAKGGTRAGGTGWT